MLKVKVNNKQIFEIDFDKELASGQINQEAFEWDVHGVKSSCGCYNIIRNNQSYNVSILEEIPEEKKFVINVRGNTYNIEVKDRFDQLLKNLGLENAMVQKINELKAPMPGLVLKLHANEGDEVKKGESILVLEAMKMENVIKSPTDGVIDKIKVKTGQAVEKNEILLTFK